MTASADTALDAIGLIEAALRRDDEAGRVLLDAGDNRTQASLLAELCAHVLAARYPQPLAVLAQMRPILLPDGSG